MLEISYYVAATVDGFIADESGNIGWLTPFESAAEDYGYAAFYESVDALVMGRRTYDFCRSLEKWPYPGKPTWVFTRSGLSSAPPDVLITSDPPVDVARLLESRGHRHVWMVGGGEIASAFRAQGLITRYIISVIPVVLGKGTPLLSPVPGAVPERLVLAGCREYPNGIVQMEYRRDAAAG